MRFGTMRIIHRSRRHSSYRSSNRSAELAQRSVTEGGKAREQSKLHSAYDAHDRAAGAIVTRRKPKLFFYRWITGDYLQLTRGWPLAARAIYRELLDAQWDGGGLPPDPDRLREIARARSDEWKEGWP